MLLKRIEPLKENYQKLEVSELSTKEIDQAINECLQKIDQNMAIFGEKFPAPATKNQNYQVIDNTEWTTAFWTGILWIAYDITKENKYKDLAEKHIESFSRRLSQNIEINHHDLGFLYTLSCVSCYKITGNSQARELSISAADKLVERFQNKGKFIQAWGDLDDSNEYRLIVDCLLNLPLLHWSYEETGDDIYKAVAEKHYKTTIKYAIRENASAFHTYYFDPTTGQPLYGKTKQGFSDDSSWARGQSWLIYGIALNQHYCRKEEDIKLYEAVTNYFLNRLPSDLICFWDLIFEEGSDQPRDTSASAITLCGMNEMEKYLADNHPMKEMYHNIQQVMLRNLINRYTEKKGTGAVALINEGVYSWHSGKGVNEGNIWGDYFYMEALVRHKKNWQLFW
ncbi:MULTISPECIES: glycoside hydrolase family 88 protein [Enterococcus]|jgi:unsaturated chondroitin disaccharide hydrolase|uniref:glycoside hydrolase family 88 protein n=1 Tax=Enterococcus TaxID=1350 RepID=UPI000A33E04C|nr:glycoside hydrolase family 88 protein [Enterococcus casseliflavus]OTO95103.1 hypothetical protein A5852_001020 [Enterococcus faecium]WEI93899.1 glycoside hydrolase family 88 protein [Enterococcus casseliflavus]